MKTSSWLPTPEQQAQIDAHWAKVRAGFHKPQAHVFGADAKSAISAHKYQASLLIDRAAHHAQMAIGLAAAEVME